MTAAIAPLGCRSEKGNMKPVKVLAFRQRRAGRSAGKAIYTKYLTPPAPFCRNVYEDGNAA